MTPSRRAAAVVCVLAIAGAAAAIGFGLRSRGRTGVSAGTARMVAWLKAKREAELIESATPAENPRQERWPINHPRSIPALRANLADAKGVEPQINIRFQLARELVWYGKNDEALQVLGEIRQIAEAVQAKVPPEHAAKLFSAIGDLTAITFFRMAEADNCLCCTSGESCLFPIRGGGVHTKQRGARGAIEVLTECLGMNPQDQGSRWLLNLAYMTVAEYPAKVPNQWLIPPQAFESEYDIGRFPNVAAERGVDRFGLAGGCILEDFDNDGDLDLMTSGFSLDEQARYFRNRGDGHFEDRTAEAGLTGLVGGLNMSHTDFNNDGNADVLILRGAWLGDHGAYPPSLLRGNGDGTFVDVTEEAGLLSYHPGQAGVWADYDGDGWLDLFLGHEDNDQGAHPSQLFHNNHDGTFTETTAACGLTNLGFVKGAAWGDYDNDNRPDLYVSRLGKENLLFHNEGPGSDGPLSWKFREVSAAAGVGQPLYSFASWFFDYDNDGWLDLFVAGFKLCPVGDITALYLGQPQSSEVPRLYHNEHNGTFTDVTHAMRLDRAILTMGANFGDLDNDGFLDIYLGNGAPDLRMLLPNRMFRNAGGKVFQDVTTSGGFGHLQKGHGIAFGDIDGDGDQDIYAVMGGWYTADAFRNCLFLNPGNKNHWITLRLQGVKTNRAAIGARIKVTVLEAAGARREIYDTVSTGGSFGGSSLQQEIGLGAANAIESIEVTWPVTGKKQVLTGVGMDRVLSIREE
jgi:VCBS repeat protein/ASPIC/UnbV protein